jgi:hypothetical protein
VATPNTRDGELDPLSNAKQTDDHVSTVVGAEADAESAASTVVGRDTGAESAASTVVGRDTGIESDGATFSVGRHRARDGTAGGPVRLDADRPHAVVVVGKRGTGKSHTLGVLAEGLAAVPGVTPVVLDTMGEFGGLGRTESAPVPAGVVVSPPHVPAAAVPSRAWPALVGLDPTGAAGGLVWEAVAEAGTLSGALEHVTGEADDRDETDTVASSVRRVAHNHLRRAARWDVFDPDGLRPAALLGDGAPTVLDCSALSERATNAVCRVVARGCYEQCLVDGVDRLPWLLVDEAHVRFDGVAGPALDRLFTRGRAPGVSVVCATQRPAALPETAVSQADLLFAHALTSAADVEALAAARPTYLDGGFERRLPRERGVALVVDDTDETAHTVRVRDRQTPDGGSSTRAREFAAGSTAADAHADVETDE